MFRNFHGMGTQMPNKEEKPVEQKPLTIAQEARKEAIQALQKKLAEGVHPNAEVQKNRITALTKLLSNELQDQHGDIAVPEELLHYSGQSANESNIGGLEKAA